jgi:hypothetical protein
MRLNDELAVFHLASSSSESNLALALADSIPNGE